MNANVTSSHYLQTITQKSTYPFCAVKIPVNTVKIFDSFELLRCITIITYICFPLMCTVYVPVNQKKSSDFNNRQQITMKFQLTPRDEEFSDLEPTWNLKISQLECPQTSTNWWKIKEIARQVWDWEEEEKDASKLKYSPGKGTRNCVVSRKN